MVEDRLLPTTDPEHTDQYGCSAISVGNLQCLRKDSQLRAVSVLGYAYEFFELVERLVKRVLLAARLDDRGTKTTWMTESDRLDLDRRWPIDGR